MDNSPDTTDGPWLLTREEVCAMLAVEAQTFANHYRALIPEAFIVRRGREVLFRADGLAAVLGSAVFESQRITGPAVIEMHRLAGRAIAEAEAAQRAEQ